MRRPGTNQIGPAPEGIAVDETGVALGFHHRVARWRTMYPAASNCLKGVIDPGAFGGPTGDFGMRRRCARGVLGDLWN